MSSSLPLWFPHLPLGCHCCPSQCVPSPPHPSQIPCARAPLLQMIYPHWALKTHTGLSCCPCVDVSWPCSVSYTLSPVTHLSGMLWLEFRRCATWPSHTFSLFPSRLQHLPPSGPPQLPVFIPMLLNWNVWEEKDKRWRELYIPFIINLSTSTNVQQGFWLELHWIYKENGQKSFTILSFPNY